ncbi:MAG: type II toxin-antitoxin system RelE/ParE family toxin [Candidatus Nanopelagicales bacterium]
MTGTCRVEIARRALKSIQALPKKEQQRVRATIELLSVNPRPPACVPLKGESSAHRVRVGDYRIVYEVHDRRLLILAVRVGHRRQVYR